jgi:hypothetical protein
LFGCYDEVYGYGPQPSKLRPHSDHCWEGSQLKDTSVNYGTVFPYDTGDDLASKTQVPVTKPRSRKCWDAPWAKPKHWWSTRSPAQIDIWLYVLLLLISASFVALVTSTVYVGLSFGAGDRWGVSEYHLKRSDTVKQHRQEVTGPPDSFVSGATWPTETRNTGILTTRAASPDMVAVSFTA